MKKALSVFALLALCACAVPQLTFQQRIALVCSNTNAALSIVSDDGLFTGGAAATLTDDVQPDVDKVCAAGATVTVANLQTIAQSTMPVVKALVTASALSAQAKDDADAAIDLVTLAINDAIALAPTATPTAAVSAPVAQ